MGVAVHMAGSLRYLPWEACLRGGLCLVCWSESGLIPSPPFLVPNILKAYFKVLTCSWPTFYRSGRFSLSLFHLAVRSYPISVRKAAFICCFWVLLEALIAAMWDDFMRTFLLLLPQHRNRFSDLVLCSLAGKEMLNNQDHHFLLLIWDWSQSIMTSSLFKLYSLIMVLLPLLAHRDMGFEIYLFLG